MQITQSYAFKWLGPSVNKSESVKLLKSTNRLLS